MTTPNEELTPLSDQDNVEFIIEDEGEHGFTPAEVDALLNAPPDEGETIVASAQPDEPVYDQVDTGGDTVPWHVARNSSKCPSSKPYAVVKDADGSVAGCHATEASANDQLRALYASEPKMARASGDCGPGQHQMPDGTCMDDSEMTPGMASMEAGTTAQTATEQPWEGVLVVENAETGDGRMFAANALSWPQLPVPLLYQKVTSHGGDTDESVNVGRIDEMWRDGNKVMGRGVLDMLDPHGREAARKIKDKYLRGVSIDADSVKDSDVEYVFPEGPGEDATEEEQLAALFAAPELTVFHNARIRATTLVNIPAFVEAYINLVGGPMTVLTASTQVTEVCEPCGDAPSDEPLIAAGHTITIADLPDPEWFDEPDALPPIGAVWVDDDGHFFGCIGPSGVAHRAFKNKRVEIPMGKVDYSAWMNRPTIVRGGDRVATGVVTMDCGHMSPYASTDPIVRMSHYDNSCSIAAVACVGESSRLKAPWIAGALMPMSAADFQRFMACQLSGDWTPHRDRPGWMEFVAALAVPVPGFARSTKTARVRVENGVVVASAVPIHHISELPRPAATNFRRRLAEIKLQVAATPAVSNRQKLAAIRAQLKHPTP